MNGGRAGVGMWESSFFPPAFLCPTGENCFGLNSAPHSTLQKALVETKNYPVILLMPGKLRGRAGGRAGGERAHGGGCVCRSGRAATVVRVGWRAMSRGGAGAGHVLKIAACGPAGSLQLPGFRRMRCLKMLPLSRLG